MRGLACDISQSRRPPGRVELGGQMRNKVVPSALQAIADLQPGMRVMYGGFAPTMSLPISLLSAVVAHGASDLTVIGCTIGYGHLGPQMLAEAGLVKKFIGSAATQVARPTVFEDQILDGEIDVEIVPQGTLAERMRAAGAGLAAFYTLTGAGTTLEENREVREFDGRRYLLEPALRADFALLWASEVDEAGNCRFEGTTRNFQTVMATAADVVVVEAEKIVPVGQIDPEDVHLPGIFIDRVVAIEVPYEERMEVARVQPRDVSGKAGSEKGLDRDQMGLRAAKLIAGYDYVNLGIGLPVLAGRWLEKLGARVILHGENGVVGYRTLADKSQWNPNVFDAGSQPAELVPGSAIVDSAGAFTMARGGHLDAVVLGAYEVSRGGDIANWARPGVGGPLIGGAMDLIAGESELIVVLEHTTRKGQPRIVEECTLPVTGRGCVNTIITNLAVIDVEADGLRLRELAPGVTVEEVVAATGCPLIVPDDVPVMGL